MPRRYVTQLLISVAGLQRLKRACSRYVMSSNEVGRTLTLDEENGTGNHLME